MYMYVLTCLMSALLSAESFLWTLDISTASVSTTCGQVQGTIEDGTNIFRGIPYAKPPLKDLRWRPPQPPTKADNSCWNGTFQATTFGNMCFQRGGTNSSILKGDEDCLYLNVWTPSVAPTAKLPVMVWIHGGYLTGLSGHSDTYAPNPRVVNSTGAVFVSMNYRLHVFGFMALDILAADSETGTSGNYGFMDQILALQWVRDNIANFGGDPNQVTVFGHSSGGTSIMALLASPLCQGLFQKAWMIGTSPVMNKTAADAFVDNTVFLNNTNCENVTCLRGLSASDLTLAVPWDVYPNWAMEDLLDLPVKGVFDGALAVIDGYVLKEAPFEAWVHGRMIDVPLLIGTTAQETDFFAATSIGLNWTEYEALVRKHMEPFGELVTAQALKFYPPGVGTPELQYTTLSSNIRTGCGNDYMSLIASMNFKAPVYRYVATQTLSEPMHPFRYPLPASYAFHGVDIFAFFETLDSYIPKLSSDDLAWQVNIQREVMSFVKTGHPATNTWNPYSVNVAELSVQTKVTDGYKREECMFWLTNGFFSYSWIN